MLLLKYENYIDYYDSFIPTVTRLILYHNNNNSNNNNNN